MAKVRKAATVSGSQLAHYFADKRALIRAVIGRQMQVVLNFHRQPRLGGLQSFDDFERWIDLNMRYLKRIGYEGTPTYHALAGQLAKSDAVTRETLGAGYWQWVELLEQAFQRMKDKGVLVAGADAATTASSPSAPRTPLSPRCYPARGQGGGTVGPQTDLLCRRRRHRVRRHLCAVHPQRTCGS